MRKRQPWSDERFETEVREVTNALGRFPTVTDLKGMDRNDLANQIARRGGFPAVADQMGLKREESDSDTGWSGEDAAAEFLRSHGFHVDTRNGIKCPYDLLVENVLRIDVKATKRCRYGHSEGWFYRIGKYAPCDVVILWQLDTSECHVLPWYVCPATNITITPSDRKYAQFRNNIDVIREMLAVRAEERQRQIPMINN